MIRGFHRQRIELLAGQVTTYEPRLRSANVLQIINHIADTVNVASTADPAAYPEFKAGPQGSVVVPLSAPREQVNIVCATAGKITIMEYDTPDITMVMPMQVIVTDISSALDVSDRAARALGKAGLQVAGADVGNTNPVAIVHRGSSSHTGGTAAANTQVQVVIAAVAGQQVRIRSIAAGYSGAAPAAPVQLTLADGTITRYLTVTSSGLALDWANGLAFTLGAALTVTLPAGGAGAIGSLVIEYDQF